jgi:hypothetical protein
VHVLTRVQIVEALERLDRALGERGTRAELYLVGGAVMCLALDASASRCDLRELAVARAPGHSGGR